MINISSYINKLENSAYGKMSNVDMAKEDLKALLSNVVDTYCKRMDYSYLWLTEDSIILENFVREEAKEVEEILKLRLDKTFEDFMQKDVKEYVRGY